MCRRRLEILGRAAGRNVYRGISGRFIDVRGVERFGHNPHFPVRHTAIVPPTDAVSKRREEKGTRRRGPFAGHFTALPSPSAFFAGTGLERSITYVRGENGDPATADRFASRGAGERDKMSVANALAGADAPRFGSNVSISRKPKRNWKRCGGAKPAVRKRGLAGTDGREIGAELHSVFAKKVRIGEIDQASFQRLTRRFRGDVAAKRLRVIRLTAAHFQSAERLIRRIGLTKNLRTLDALQLAVALNLNEPGQPIEFVCADHALCTLAIAEGLSVVNPEVI